MTLKMHPAGIIPEARNSDSKRGLVILLFFALALAVHFVFFLAQVNWFHLQPPPSRVDLVTIDPKKLNKIKQDWEKKGLLLDHDSAPSQEQASDRARYLSNKNRVVEKETQARMTDIFPSGSKVTQKIAKKGHPTATTTYPKIGDLGLPLKLESTPIPTAVGEQSDQNSPRRYQALLDESIPYGSETLLNTQESVYYSFFYRIYEMLGPIWKRNISDLARKMEMKPGSYTTLIDIILDAEGNVVNAVIIQSSGKFEVDRAAEKACRTIKQYPNPPKGLMNAEKIVHIGWQFGLEIREGGFNF